MRSLAAEYACVDGDAFAAGDVALNSPQAVDEEVVLTLDGRTWRESYPSPKKTASDIVMVLPMIPSWELAAWFTGISVCLEIE